MQTGFCSPSSTRSFGATPFPRNSFNWSEMYCVGFLFVVCVPASLIIGPLTLRDLCALCVNSFFFLMSLRHHTCTPLPHSVRIQKNLPRQPTVQFRKRVLKFLQRLPLPKQRFQI